MTVKLPYDAGNFKNEHKDISNKIKAINEFLDILEARDSQIHKLQQENFLEVGELKRELASRPLGGEIFNPLIHEHKSNLKFSKQTWSYCVSRVDRWKNADKVERFTQKEFLDDVNSKIESRTKFTAHYLRMIEEDVDNVLVNLCL